MKHSQKTITVLGGNGRLGRAAAIAFQKAGFGVTVMTRNGKVTGEISRNIRVVPGDAMNPEAVIRACRHAKFVFNGLNPKYTEWHKLAMPMARNVMRACRETGAIHLFPGNIYNYGSAIPAVVTGHTPQDADTKKGRIRMAMEHDFRREAETNGVQTIILRAGDFFGGSMHGAWFDEVVTAGLSKRVFRYPGNPDIAHAWAYLPDLAQAFVSLAEQAGKLEIFEVFLFPGHTLTGLQMQEAVENALSAKLRRKSLPWWLIRLACPVVPMMREIGELSYLWFRPHQLESKRLEGIIGEIPHTPVDVAVRKSLADLGKLENSGNGNSHRVASPA